MKTRNVHIWTGHFQNSNVGNEGEVRPITLLTETTTTLPHAITFNSSCPISIYISSHLQASLLKTVWTAKFWGLIIEERRHNLGSMLYSLNFF